MSLENLPNNFDKDIYRYLNPDLNNLDNEELQYHYLLYGFNEGRKFEINNPNDFDLNKYKELNYELNELSDYELQKHYFLYGRNEGRVYYYDLPNNFNCDHYRLLNKDLNKLSNIELKLHYYQIGKNENRQYLIELPENFDVNKYRELNIDINYLNDDELKVHYFLEGKYQNRSYFYEIPEDFDVNIYKYLNSELINFTDHELKLHYYLYGKYENRSYKYELPEDFNVNNYKLLNNDIKNLSDKEAQIHFFLNGKNENRVYKYQIPEDFNINNYRYLNNDLKNLSDKELELHYFLYGKNENRIYNSNNFINIVNNLFFNNFINIEINNIESNIIFSLTSIPNRFLNNSFDKIIDSIYNQIIKPKYIIINLCHKYKRNFEYDNNLFQNKISQLKNKYNNLIINFSEDYGPITKILGLLNLSHVINENDKIIVIDDDWIIKNNMSYYYELTYELYNCECVFIDERYLINWDNNMELLESNVILYDNYQNFVYGWLSFSFKYKYVERLYDFYKSILFIDNEIIKHDDLILTLFYKLNKIYSCGINLFLNIYERQDLENIDALKNMYDSWNFRFNLEQKILNIYNINNTLLRNHVYIENLKINNSEIFIEKNINERKILFNIENITYYPDKNNFYNKHIDIKYFSKNIFILTITYFKEFIDELDSFIININNIEYNISIYFNNTFSKKQTFFIYTNIELVKINHKIYNFNIIQTNNQNIVSLNKFYSINTILTYIPDINYSLYDEIDRINFINSFNSVLLNIYKKLNVGAYKADFFRALYIYINGGLYMDCKNILYSNINNLLNKNECYVKDLNNGICNGFIYCSFKKDKKIKNYIKAIIYNIFNSLYLDSCLHVTGPKLFVNFIEDNIYLKNNIMDNDWQNSYFTYIDNDKIIIKVSYKNYYEENNYLNNFHYDTLYNQHNIYNNIKHEYYKINFISKILWINLERSVDRKNYMENLLKNINIENIRINAIDGKNDNIRNIINIPFTRDLSNYEIACTLSHIKAINYLNKIDGNFFMICEDDITLNNLILFNTNLNDIILNSPEFDILILNKIYLNNLKNLYEKWNDYNIDLISGTACYIISRKGINKIIKNAEYLENNNFIFNQDKFFDVADIYLYKNLETYVYKYNFIGTIDKDSTIHNDHVNHHTLSTNFQIEEIINDIL
jgi:GR25 family glycosyltransferase involved in LPS biosynthesis